MKHSMRALAMLGLAAALAAPAALRSDEGEDQQRDLKVRLQALEEAVSGEGGLESKLEALNKFNIEGFTDIRFDRDDVPQANTGFAGAYGRRAEVKMFGQLSPSLGWILGYDFQENKVKDLGVELKDLPFLPFVDLPDYAWTLRAGQFRIPFGIAAQTSSSGIMFSERPVLNGGRVNSNTAFGAVTTTAFPSATNNKSYSPGKLVSERAMGLQLRQQVKYPYLLNYDLQLGAFNNVTQDQAVGTNSLAAAYSSQASDTPPSYAARLGLELDFLQQPLNNRFNNKNKVLLGASYMYDSQNSAWLMATPDKRGAAEILGAELQLELANKLLVLQSEYVRSSVRSTSGSAPAWKGSEQLTEGWYAQAALDLLPFFATPEKGDALTLQASYEAQHKLPKDGAGTQSIHAFNRLGAGIKWSYLGGKNHTSINYLVSAPDNMFGGDYRAAGDRGTGMQLPESLLIVQQQYSFSTK